MKKPKTMSAEEYKALKTRLGASYSAIARSVGVSHRTAIRWASSGLRGGSVTVLRAMERAGTRGISEPMDKLIRIKTERTEK